MGDSHSYGVGVRREEAWPALLGAYNMALPSYGPGQSLLQLDEALQMKPSVMVVAPYFGNDFYETFELSLRHPDLADGIDSTLLRAAEQAEKRRGLETEIQNLFSMGAAPPSEKSGLRRWVSNHSRLYGLARAIRHVIQPDPPNYLLSRDYVSATAALATAQTRFALPVVSGSWRTILTPAYRAQALDDRDPRIRVGFEAATLALRALLRRSRQSGVKVLIVLLPTKESVFAPRVSSTPELASLVAGEARLRDEMTRALMSDGADLLDMTPGLRAATTQPYFEDIDGHPNPSGHRLIADSVAARIRLLLPHR